MGKIKELSVMETFKKQKNLPIMLVSLQQQC